MGRFWLKGLSPSLQVISHDEIDLGIFLKPELFGTGYEAEDSLFLRGMDERKGSLLLGLEARLKLDRLKLEVNIEQDIYDRHHGRKAQVFLGSGIPLNLFIDSIPFTLFKLSLGAGYYSSAYNNYYYGVKPSEATPDRAVYSPGSSISLLLKSSIMVKITKDFTLTIGYANEVLGREVKDSPITNGNNSDAYSVFLTYSL
tara:strand:+ start:352 stop:951 length:600 start_codon:yes stop_codon:yes gene_type:complete